MPMVERGRGGNVTSKTGVLTSGPIVGRGERGEERRGRQRLKEKL